MWGALEPTIFLPFSKNWQYISPSFNKDVGHSGSNSLITYFKYSYGFPNKVAYVPLTRTLPL